MVHCVQFLSFFPGNSVTGRVGSRMENRYAPQLDLINRLVWGDTIAALHDYK